eukprot:2468237-Prymnesium_polylepis.1
MPPLAFTAFRKRCTSGARHQSIREMKKLLKYMRSVGSGRIVGWIPATAMKSTIHGRNVLTVSTCDSIVSSPNA